VLAAEESFEHFSKLHEQLNVDLAAALRRRAA
jgi:hypothetical protein